jgi:hypothetical protein
MPSTNLLATAGSLQDLRQSIIDYYGGTDVTLSPGSTPGEWQVLITSSGLPIYGVRVRSQRYRYRFEQVPPPKSDEPSRP